MANNLQSHNKNFKYMSTFQLMQKKSGGMEGSLCIEATTHWNDSTDGRFLVQWENNEFYVFVTVFGCALWEFSILKYLGFKF